MIMPHIYIVVYTIVITYTISGVSLSTNHKGTILNFKKSPIDNLVPYKYSIQVTQ